MERPLRDPRGGDGRAGGARTLLLFGAALTLLLAVVALASQGGVESRRSQDGGGSFVPTAVYDVVFTLFIVSGLLIVPILAWSYARETVGDERRKKPKVLPFVFIGLFLAVAVVFSLGDELRDAIGRIRFGDGDNDGTSRRAPTYQPSFEWAAAALGVGVAALAAGTIAARRAVGRRGERRNEEQLAAALARALDESIDDIVDEPDTRRAIIRAYARMESALDCCGLPRRESEAPLEYLSRVLLELDVRSRPVESLTELFERAKFSDHHLSAELKQDAIDALQDVRADVRELL